MASYTTQANSYDNVFIHKVPEKEFNALAQLVGGVVEGGEDKYLSFKVGNVEITAFRQPER